MSKSMMFLYVETPLHAGTGRALGTVDLPIQRERSTGYPMIQASGIKGRLRAHYEDKMKEEDLSAVFGPKTDQAADYAGALSFGDARLLLFPVRSLAGVFAWCTSLDVLARFTREAERTGISIQLDLPQDGLKDNENKAWVSGERNKIKVNGKDNIVLEDFAFEIENKDISKIAEELGKALPNSKEYDYWRNILKEGLCILPKDAFRDFTLYATEVQTHIKLHPDKKTVEPGALWTTESLPMDTVMYVPLAAQKSRYADNKLSDDQVLKKLIKPENEKYQAITRINFGGDETTGQGYVAVKYVEGAK